MKFLHGENFMSKIIMYYSNRTIKRNYKFKYYGHNGIVKIFMVSLWSTITAIHNNFGYKIFCY